MKKNKKISAGSVLGTNDLITKSPAQTSNKSTTSFEAAGDVSLGYDLNFDNSTASYIKSIAPLYLEAGEVFNSSDLTLRTFNYGNIILDGAGTQIIGSSTSVALAITSGITNGNDVFTIATSTSGSIFRVTGYGNVYADGTMTGGGADYAEYFYSQYTDLMPGETVCIDLTLPNAVARCYRGHDNNVMGIVSTKPSIVGNNSAAVQGDAAHYAIIGMLGQVDAFVSAENGVINVGDSLTSASSTPGYAMKADGGDSTVGVALEPFPKTNPPTPLSEGGQASKGKIKVLISRRNKSLAVEEVEALVVERIANMKIEDQVQAMIKQSVNNLNFDPKIKQIAQEEAGKLDAALTVRLDDVNGAIANLRTQTLTSLTELNSRVNDLALNNLGLGVKIDNLTASTSVLMENIRIDEKGRIVIGKNPLNPPLQGGQDGITPLPKGGENQGGGVEIVDITMITASSTQTAFVVNQVGIGEIADFQAQGVSIMSIAQTGEVKVVGSLLVDGRIMLCTGGNCSNALDSAVDETMADLGVEGKVVAGAFEGYCADGYVWVPGSAKYGTLPGFCVMNDFAGVSAETPLTPLYKGGNAWTNLSQGQAQVACQTIGSGYHLMGENEWLTIAENILTVAANDADANAAGMQLETPLTPLYKGGEIAFKLTNDNIINNLVGTIAQWTNQNVTAAGLPVTPSADNWFEYNEVSDFKGLNIAPDYYLTDANNYIGKIYIGSNAGLKGFVRGSGGIYGLDLSHAPSEQSQSIGFRCAK